MSDPLGEKTAIEVLYGARELLAIPLCWMRGDYSDGDLGAEDCWKHSLAGALMASAGVDKVTLFTDVPTAFYDALLAVANEVDPSAIDTDSPYAVSNMLNRIETWNDSPLTTHADVLDLLERAHRLLVALA